MNTPPPMPSGDAPLPPSPSLPAAADTYAPAMPSSGFQAPAMTPVPNYAAAPREPSQEAQVAAYLNQPVLDGGRPVRGTEGMTLGQVEDDVMRGGTFRLFPWSFSIMVMSFRRSSPLYYVRSDGSVGGHAWLWSLPTMVVGWWGIPWGIIFTLMCLSRNFMGGHDVTRSVMGSLVGPQRASGVMARAPKPKADVALWLLRIFLLGIPAAIALLIATAGSSR